MELLIEELGGSVIMLLLGSGVIGVLVYVSNSAVIVTELIKKYVKVREHERSIQTVWRRADCSGRHKCISRVDGKYCAGSGRHACAAYKYMG